MRNPRFGFTAFAVIVALLLGYGYAVSAEKDHEVGLQRNCSSEFRDRDYNRDNTLTYEEFESGRYAFGAPAGLGPDISGRGFASGERTPNSRMSEREFCAMVGGGDTAS